MDTTAKLPNIWWEWSRGLKIGSLKWFWYTCSCFHPCRWSNSQKTTFFQYNSLVLMHKNVWKTIHASCNQALCVFFQAFQGLAKNQEGRRVASLLFGSWVPWVKLSWRWASEPQGQGVKPHLNVLGHSVMAEIGHPLFAKLLFNAGLFLAVTFCNYDIEMIGEVFELFGFQR